MNRFNDFRFVIRLLCLLLVLSPLTRASEAIHVPTNAASKLDDATIFAIFDEANSTDIAIARLGVKKAQSADVRELARSVADDHEQVQEMTRTLAKKLNIVPRPPDNDT